MKGGKEKGRERGREEGRRGKTRIIPSPLHILKEESQTD